MLIFASWQHVNKQNKIDYGTEKEISGRYTDVQRDTGT